MKLKTRKTVAKRFKITKNKKVLRREVGQDHFNALESGNIRRHKRRDKGVAKASRKMVLNMLPYNR